MQAQHPPPVAWASDGLPDGSPGPSQRYASTSADEAGDVGAVASAWKHVKAVSSRDEGRSSDLWDLLSHSLRETQYSPAPPEVMAGREGVKARRQGIRTQLHGMTLWLSMCSWCSPKHTRSLLPLSPSQGYAGRRAVPPLTKGPLPCSLPL